MIAANNGWVLAFDNLSGLRPWLSDALCRLSTGGGFSTRELYSNDQETIFSAMRPIILNGIDDIATRHDLADRSIVVNLPVIPEARRRSEADLMKEFETVRPYILGALCDAISMGLRNAQSTKLSSLPRMADFALWVSAAEPALPWERGQFVKCYLGNRGDVVDLALDGDQVADAVREMMMNKDAWEGKPSDLLECIEGYASEKAQKGKSWPKAPSALSRALKRSATFLRAVDIEISFLKKDRKRVIAIRKVVQNAVSAVSNTADDSQAHDSNEENGRRHFQQTPSPEGKIPSPPGQIPSPEDDGGNNGTDRNNSSAWNF
jgi:hypothetical protein